MPTGHASTLQLYRRGIRAETARDFLSFLSDRRYDGKASEEDARRAHELYRQHLRDDRDRHGLSFLQPGRFLDPDSPAEKPFMWFAPLDIPEGVQSTASDTLAGMMEERFEAYKAQLVMPFYTQYFRNYWRQVVLVDVLGALLAGREVFEDTRRAIDAILESFRYGHSGIIRRLLGSTRIEKVLFAATKADHVPEVQRDHLAALMRSMVAPSSLDVISSNAMTDVIALASVISTEDDTQRSTGSAFRWSSANRSVARTGQNSSSATCRPGRQGRTAGAKPFLNIPVFEPPVIDVFPTDGIRTY